MCSATIYIRFDVFRYVRKSKFFYKRTKTVVGARYNIQKTFIAVGVEYKFDNKTVNVPLHYNV